jgi:AcrR family transcriptional regulator
VPPTKVRTGELRERLLQVAVEILAADGVSGLTTRRIASRARTSAPAIYELFGDKAGLVRALFFEGFRRLGRRLERLPPPAGTTDDLAAVVREFRAFTLEDPRLFEVMYTKPFDVFSPGGDEQALGDATRAVLVDRARACVATGEIDGDPVDVAHAVLALAIGLATQETAGWLGSTTATRDRRWKGATRALLAGYAPRAG